EGRLRLPHLPVRLLVLREVLRSVDRLGEVQLVAARGRTAHERRRQQLVVGFLLDANRGPARRGIDRRQEQRPRLRDALAAGVEAVARAGIYRVVTLSVAVNLEKIFGRRRKRGGNQQESGGPNSAGLPDR